MPLYPETNESNLLKFLRMQRAFEPPGMEQNTQLPNVPVDDFNVSSRLNELYKPDDTMSNRYLQHVGQMPERNVPGIARKLTASAAALGRGGIDEADRILYDPYYQQMQEWKAKADPLQTLASQERMNNTNMRGLATTAVTQERLARDRDKTESRLVKSQEERTRVQDATLEQRRLEASAKQDLENRKLALAQAKSDMPDLQFKTDINNKIIGLDTKTGKSYDTGVKSDELSDLEKLRIGLNNQLRAIEARGNVEEGLIGARAEAEKGNIGARGAEARKTKETPGVAPIVTPTETKTDVTVTGPDGKPLGTRSTTSTRKPIPQGQYKPGDKAPAEIQKKAAPGEMYIRNNANTGWTAIRVK